jgi:hypothetical protein
MECRAPSNWRSELQSVYTQRQTVDKVSGCHGGLLFLPRASAQLPNVLLLGDVHGPQLHIPTRKWRRNPSNSCSNVELFMLTGEHCLRRGCSATVLLEDNLFAYSAVNKKYKGPPATGPFSGLVDARSRLRGCMQYKSINDTSTSDLTGWRECELGCEQNKLQVEAVDARLLHPKMMHRLLHTPFPSSFDVREWLRFFVKLGTAHDDDKLQIFATRMFDNDRLAREYVNDCKTKLAPMLRAAEVELQNPALLYKLQELLVMVHSVQFESERQEANGQGVPWVVVHSIVMDYHVLLRLCTMSSKSVVVLQFGTAHCTTLSTMLLLLEVMFATKPLEHSVLQRWCTRTYNTLLNEVFEREDGYTNELALSEIVVWKSQKLTVGVSSVRRLLAMLCGTQ